MFTKNAIVCALSLLLLSSVVNSIDVVDADVKHPEWCVQVGGDATQLRNGWEYRGQYGAVNMFATTASIQNSENAEKIVQSAPGKLLKAGRSTPIWIIESAQLTEVKRVLDESHITSTILIQLPNVTIVTGQVFNVAGLPNDAVRIPVATNKVATVMKRNSSSHKIVTEPNPLIAEALRQIQSDSLQSTVEQLSSYFTRISTSGDVLDAEIWLTGELIRNGFEISTFPFRANFSSNIIAKKTGTRYPDQVVIVGAHYDSRAVDSSDPTQRAPGADDNGSGSAAVLELARVIARTGLEFEYTLQLMLFSGEEQGLLGSRAYAADLAEKGGDVVAMFNSDMLGWKLPGTVPTVGMKDRFVADWLLAAANAYTEIYVPELKVATSASCCSDHQSFTENGFPAIGFFENPGGASDYPHYHKSTDLPQYIDKQNHLLITEAMMASAMSFAVPDADATKANTATKK